TEQISGNSVHRAACREPAVVALSHPALGDASAVSQDRQWACSRRAVRRDGPPPNRLRWNPLPFPDEPADFIDALVTMGGNGDAGARCGVAVHIYCATKQMEHRVLYDADGELLIVPQTGRLRLATELGVVEAKPGEIAVIPRGVKFRVELPDG